MQRCAGEKQRLPCSKHKSVNIISIFLKAYKLCQTVLTCCMDMGPLCPVVPHTCMLMLYMNWTCSIRHRWLCRAGPDRLLLPSLFGWTAQWSVPVISHVSSLTFDAQCVILLFIQRRRPGNYSNHCFWQKKMCRAYSSSSSRAHSAVFHCCF